MCKLHLYLLSFLRPLISLHSKVLAEEKNPRGIPTAPFIDKVEDYVSSGDQVESTLKSFQEMISSVSLHFFPLFSSLLSSRVISETNEKKKFRKYQFMELNTQRRLSGLQDKMPEMQKSLDTVRFLASRRPSSNQLKTTFSLNDTLYAHALIPSSSSSSSSSSSEHDEEKEEEEEEREVYLWLGANVMLAYPLSEAESLLVEKLDAARTSSAACQDDLDFLREQITTLEVATARVYNWDVTRKRREREGRDGDGGTKLVTTTAATAAADDDDDVG